MRKTRNISPCLEKWKNMLDRIILTKDGNERSSLRNYFPFKGKSGSHLTIGTRTDTSTIESSNHRIKFTVQRTEISRLFTLTRPVNSQKFPSWPARATKVPGEWKETRWRGAKFREAGSSIRVDRAEVTASGPILWLNYVLSYVGRADIRLALLKRHSLFIAGRARFSCKWHGSYWPTDPKADPTTILLNHYVQTISCGKEYSCTSCEQFYLTH